MNLTLTWGILGTGNIAKAFAKGLQHSKTGRLVAVGSRTQAAADRFGGEFAVAHRHGSYEALLADAEVTAIYISTPHPLHAEWAIKAAEAGKHILCEKPLAVNFAEAMAVIEAARANDVFLMEAFMYRCHPQTAKLVELLRQRVIGDVRVIQATFSFHAAFNPASRLLNNALGGGGILDVGCYCVSLARLVAGVADGKEFADPIEVKGTGHIGPVSRVDEYAIASLKFPGGIVAELATGVQLNQENVVRIFGSEGHLLIPTPWVPARDGGTTKILVHRSDEKQPTDITIDSPQPLYAIEADTVAAGLGNRQATFPAMSWDDSLGNMRTLDRWREQIGLTYDAELPANVTATVSRRPLHVRQPRQIPTGRMAGIDLPISRLVMGCDNQATMPHAAVMFDDFFERGGNVFDTAWVYAGGKQERLLGQWIKNRGLRAQVAVIGKGAHTPLCDPKHLSAQLLESLDRLQTDYVDLYLMHRDNPEIPVGEFVEVLNEHLRAGRLHAFGGSNWSTERVAAANDYARARSLTGFAAVSNNFSLARMVQPVWDGCVAASEPAAREWFTATQMPLFAWSSQARGFFTERGLDRTDAEMVRCWVSDDNLRRRERVVELAAKRGVLPLNIALAYVLCQPFPTFALIGPRTLAETRTSLPAAEVRLTPEELAWLDLR